ncbi:hypothetical protein TNCV_2436771 [Trichonephila clavipes]|nr:hypothetical protein TNCV_2436771 [Trichonephila clavipes]
MSRFGGLSEERPSVFKTRSKLGTHLSTQCSGDERQSRPCAARRDGDLGYPKALWKSGKICSPYFTYSTDAGSPTRVFVFFFLFQDIMPSGLPVHWVLIAPRDSILQNVETVTQCFTWLCSTIGAPRDSDPPVLHFTRDLLHRTTTSL